MKTKKTNKIRKIRIYKKNKLSKKKELVKLRCSPKIIKKDFTCYEDETLYKLRDLWNERHEDEQIQTNNTKEIWLKLKEHMKNVCNKESCWLKQQFVEGKLDKELTNSFAPKSPNEWKKKPNEWLSSMDILNVMKQYEQTYKCFEFIGPSPIDFDTRKMYGSCVWDELCNFNLNDQIKNGKTKIGFVFNTDPHNKPGEHWISMFINIKKGEIFFFDSVGNKAPKEIIHFVDRIKKQGQQLANPIFFKYDENYPVEHQYGNTECGIYSIFFIVHMLEDKITSHYLKTHILKDKYMQKFRKVYFNEDL
jgi:hypothetical protein